MTLDEIERHSGDIADSLHANAIRITGNDVARLASAGEVAARHGLEIWLSPMFPNADPTTTLTLIAETARVAEDIRRNGPTTALVEGVTAALVEWLHEAASRSALREAARGELMSHDLDFDHHPFCPQPSAHSSA